MKLAGEEDLLLQAARKDSLSCEDKRTQAPRGLAAHFHVSRKLHFALKTSLFLRHFQEPRVQTGRHKQAARRLQNNKPWDGICQRLARLLHSDLSVRDTLFFRHQPGDQALYEAVVSGSSPSFLCVSSSTSCLPAWGKSAQPCFPSRSQHNGTGLIGF